MMTASARIGAALSLAAALACGKSRAETEWSHGDWYASAPQSLATFSAAGNTGKPRTAVGFGANGDVLIGDGTVGGRDFQLTRLGQSAGLRWASNLYPYGYMLANTLLGNDDGGAIVALGLVETPDPGAIERIDSSGTRLWSRELPSGWLVKVGTSRIASAGCSALTVLDSASGNVAWQRSFAYPHLECRGGGVVVDEQAQMYAAFEEGGYVIADYRIFKIDAEGHESWNVALPGNISRTVAGVGAGHLIIASPVELVALSTVDGSETWRTPVASNARVLMTADGSGDPIVLDNASVQRVDAGSGSAIWTRPLSSSVASMVGSSVVLAYGGGITKLDALTGTTAWSLSSVWASEVSPEWLGLGGLAGNTFVVAARTFNPTARPLLARIDFATGAVVGSIDTPPIPQAIDGATTFTAEGDALGVGLSGIPRAFSVNLRAVDSATGAPLWETTDPIDEGLFDGWYVPPQTLAAISTDRIAVSLSTSQWVCDSTLTHPFPISLYRRSDGGRVWRTVLVEDASKCARVSRPEMDPDGNVFAVVEREVQCPAPDWSYNCSRNTLYKLSATDGSVVWRLDADRMDGDADRFMMIGSNVLKYGPFPGSTDTLRLISGIDGSTIWTSNLFAPDSIGDEVYRVDAGHLVVFPRFGTSPLLTWAKLDVTTGATVWERTTQSPPCDVSGCTGNDAAILPNGDVLYAGERAYSMSVKRLHNDGSGVIEEQLVGQNDPEVESWINWVRPDETGQWHAMIVRRVRRPTLAASVGSATFLADFDPATGQILAQQAWRGFTGNTDAWRAMTWPASVRMPTPNQLFISTLAKQPPTPMTASIDSIDLTVTAHGDLAASIEIDRTRVSLGDAVTFHAKATYSGDQPLTHAALAANLPWQSGVSGLQCAVHAASNCVVDTASGNVSATFDITPGGSIELSGSVRVLDIIGTPMFSAMTFGPVGLREQDTVDNFARSVIAQSLFFDGFDAR